MRLQQPIHVLCRYEGLSNSWHCIVNKRLQCITLSDRLPEHTEFLSFIQKSRKEKHVARYMSMQVAKGSLVIAGDPT